MKEEFVNQLTTMMKTGEEEMGQDLSKCPNCGGEADNGHDRCYPPNVYFCTKCNEEDDMAFDEQRDNENCL